MGIEKQVDDFLNQISEAGLLFKTGVDIYLKGKKDAFLKKADEIAEVEVPEDLFMKAWKEDGDRPGVGVHPLNQELKEWVCKAIDGPSIDNSMAIAA